MLSPDQIQRELQAIVEFDRLFLANNKHRTEEVVGFELRKLRKQELLRSASRRHRRGSILLKFSTARAGTVAVGSKPFSHSPMM